MDKKYDVLGIGNALLDFIVEVDDGVLAEMNLAKGQFTLIDKEKSKELLKRLEKYQVKTAPGGSSANTLAGVSVLGGNAVLIGKVGKDNHGDIYEQKTSDCGVKVKFSRHDSEMTGHCITFITPDAERTFATHLGAALHLRKEDVFEEEIKSSKILHTEGYQLEDLNLKETTIHAMKIAKANGVKVSIDLSDPGLIGRNLEPIKKLVKDYADIIFVNEAEAEALTGKKDEKALHEIYDVCEIAIVKLGEKGSLIKADDIIYRVPAYKTKVVNTNGAGDIYAAGILYGIAKGIEMERAGKIASYAASLVVGQTEARLNRKINVKEI